jgi:hypothetical protein
MQQLRRLFTAKRSAHRIAELRQRIETLEDALPLKFSSREGLESELYRTIAEMVAVQYALSPDNPHR